ncbi:MAG: hypothetical protein ACI9R3_003642 [Verrucomicrobiales bacterium]|jgi:hypothetical protein
MAFGFQGRFGKPIPGEAGEGFACSERAVTDTHNEFFSVSSRFGVRIPLLAGNSSKYR